MMSMRHMLADSKGSGGQIRQAQRKEGLSYFDQTITPEQSGKKGRTPPKSDIMDIIVDRGGNRTFRKGDENRITQGKYILNFSLYWKTYTQFLTIFGSLYIAMKWNRLLNDCSVGNTETISPVKFLTHISISDL